jgi:hypothetical protein
MTSDPGGVSSGPAAGAAVAMGTTAAGSRGAGVPGALAGRVALLAAVLGARALVVTAHLPPEGLGRRAGPRTWPPPTGSPAPALVLRLTSKERAPQEGAGVAGLGPEELSPGPSVPTCH